MKTNDLSYGSNNDNNHTTGCQSDTGCTTVVNHTAEVSVSIDVKPIAKVGKIEAECCQDPVVCTKQGKNKDTCEITIIQELSIKIPIEYNVIACIGDSEVDCESCSDGK